MRSAEEGGVGGVGRSSVGVEEELLLSRVFHSLSIFYHYTPIHPLLASHSSSVGGSALVSVGRLSRVSAGGCRAFFSS